MSESDQQITPQEDSTNLDVLDDIPLHDLSTSPIPVIPELSIALGLLVFVFGVTYIGASNTFTKKSPSNELFVENTLQVPATKNSAQINAFDGITIEAKSAIVWDVQNQRILFNKNGDEQLPLASVAKLMTALVAYELLDPDEKVAISLSSLKTEGDSGFVDGEEFSLRNLVDLTLISSSNDGATALGVNAGNIVQSAYDSETVFIKAMNVKAEELGLTKTYFKNTTGLDISPNLAGAYGSARDVSLLMEYILTHITDAVSRTNLGVTTIDNEDGEYHLAKNTNEIVTQINGLIASKTGYTPLAGGNLVIAFNAGLNRPVIVTVLGSTPEGRFGDTLNLVQRARLFIDREME